MALVINDRVKETTTTTGTGAVSLGGAVTGFETFAAGIGNSNTTYYAIVHQTAAEFEVGLGTLDGDSSDLTRTTVISSSNSDSAVDFAAGTKDVFCTMPASKLVFEDASSDVTLPNDLILGSDSAVLKFGADSDTTLTHTDGTGLTLNSTNKLLFRDSALYINSSTDGQLDIVADTEVQIAATTIDINGAVALNGAITGATNITLSGELDAATLDISGDADIDGTLEADAITVDGTTLAEFISDTTGAMFSSNTETGITVTYQDADNTIDLALAAAQTTITSLLATDIKIGEDDQTKIDFETADEIHFYAANVEQVYLGDNIFGPQSDSDVDLGSTGVRWKDAFVDSLTVTGDISVGDDLTVEGGVVDVKNTGAQSVVRFYCESSNAHYAEIKAPAHSAFSGNVTLTLPAATDTLVGRATTDTLTNKSIDSDNNTITNIVNADIKSSAAIADTKLATISTAGKVALTALEIDGGSDIGADLTTSDLIIVDDGAGGTNKKAALSRMVTLMAANLDDPTALAIALG